MTAIEVHRPVSVLGGSCEPLVAPLCVRALHERRSENEAPPSVGGAVELSCVSDGSSVSGNSRQPGSLRLTRQLLGRRRDRLERQHRRTQDWHRALDTDRVAVDVIAQVQAYHAFASVALWVFHAHLDDDRGEAARPSLHGVAPNHAHGDGIAVAVVMAIDVTRATDALSVIGAEWQGAEVIDEGELIERAGRAPAALAALILPPLLVGEHFDALLTAREHPARALLVAQRGHARGVDPRLGALGALDDADSGMNLRSQDERRDAADALRAVDSHDASTDVAELPDRHAVLEPLADPERQRCSLRVQRRG